MFGVLGLKVDRAKRIMSAVIFSLHVRVLLNAVILHRSGHCFNSKKRRTLILRKNGKQIQGLLSALEGMCGA